MEIQLIYTSVAARDFLVEELDQLLVTSAAFNESRNIFGMLLYANGKFLQVLEGEAAVVDALLQKILADNRHTQVNILVRTPIQQRDFMAWSMGFRRLDGNRIGNVENFVPFFDKNFDQDSVCDRSNLALAVLKSFAAVRY